MNKKVTKAASTKALIKKLRKPTAPPTRVAEDERRYKRAREIERLRRKPSDNDETTDETIE